MLVRIFNGIVQVLAWIANIVLFLLPDTPFNWEVMEQLRSSTWYSYFAYFLPIDGMISVLTVYLISVVGYYAIRWILRLIRYID